MSEEDGAFWGNTIGNTFLSSLDRRDKGATDWDGFKQHMLPSAICNEWRGELSAFDNWDASAVEQMGKRLAEVAGDVWY